MAASEETCEENPDFAVICSFITKFGDDCGVNISIPYLKQLLEDTKIVSDDLSELLIHLLRRGRKRVTKERWEKSLIKFCHEYSSVDAWELERFGYKNSKLSVKLELLKRLLELQFDSNAKFKCEVNKQDAQSLRIPPIGRDINGHVYWYQLDKDYNMRLYRQSSSESNEWQLLCSTTDELKSLLESLEKGTNIKTETKEESKESSENTDTVQKIDTDGDDLKACISQTKPCTIIIKTERKETLLSMLGSDGIKLINDSDSNATLANEENPILKQVPNEADLKIEDNQNEANVKVKLESAACEEAKKALPMEVDECVVEKSDLAQSKDVSVSDAEMTNVEIEKHENEQRTEDSTKSKKLSEEKVSSNAVSSICSSLPKSSHQKSSLSDPIILQKPENEKEILQTKQFAPSITSTNESIFKGGKFKQYERWNNEKKQAAAHSVKPDSLIAHDLSSSKRKSDMPLLFAEDLSRDSKKSSQLPSPLSSKPPKSSSKCEDSSRDEAPMDLSVSHRNSSTINKSSAESSPCDFRTDYTKISNLSKSNAECNGGKDKPAHLVSPVVCKQFDNFKSIPDISRPMKKKHVSMSKEEILNQNSELSRKSVIFEVKNSKLNQYQENQTSSDSIIPNKTVKESSFSHLQALQNMCDTNMMINVQNSVIHPLNSDKRLNSNSISNKTCLNSSEKSYNDTCCDNLSKLYNFSSVQASDDLKSSLESNVPSMPLKSNISSNNKHHSDSVMKDSKSDNSISSTKSCVKSNDNVHCKEILPIHQHVDPLIPKSTDISSNVVDKTCNNSNQNSSDGHHDHKNFEKLEKCSDVDRPEPIKNKSFLEEHSKIISKESFNQEDNIKNSSPISVETSSKSEESIMKDNKILESVAEKETTKNIDKTEKSEKPSVKLDSNNKDDFAHGNSNEKISQSLVNEESPASNADKTQKLLDDNALKLPFKESSKFSDEKVSKSFDDFSKSNLVSCEPSENQAHKSSCNLPTKSLHCNLPKSDEKTIESLKIISLKTSQDKALKSAEKETTKLSKQKSDKSMDDTKKTFDKISKSPKNKIPIVSDEEVVESPIDKDKNSGEKFSEDKNLTKDDKSLETLKDIAVKISDQKESLTDQFDKESSVFTNDKDPIKVSNIKESLKIPDEKVLQSDDDNKNSDVITRKTEENILANICNQKEKSSINELKVQNNNLENQSIISKEMSSVKKAAQPNKEIEKVDEESNVKSAEIVYDESQKKTENVEFSHSSEKEVTKQISSQAESLMASGGNSDYQNLNSESQTAQNVDNSLSNESNSVSTANEFPERVNENCSSMKSKDFIEKSGVKKDKKKIKNLEKPESQSSTETLNPKEAHKSKNDCNEKKISSEKEIPKLNNLESDKSKVNIVSQEEEDSSTSKTESKIITTVEKTTCQVIGSQSESDHFESNKKGNSSSKDENCLKISSESAFKDSDLNKQLENHKKIKDNNKQVCVSEVTKQAVTFDNKMEKPASEEMEMVEEVNCKATESDCLEKEKSLSKCTEDSTSIKTSENFLDTSAVKEHSAIGSMEENCSVSTVQNSVKENLEKTSSVENEEQDDSSLKNNSCKSVQSSTKERTFESSESKSSTKESKDDMDSGELDEQSQNNSSDKLSKKDIHENKIPDNPPSTPTNDKELQNSKEINSEAASSKPKVAKTPRTRRRLFTPRRNRRKSNAKNSTNDSAKEKKADKIALKSETVQSDDDSSESELNLLALIKRKTEKKSSPVKDDSKHITCDEVDTKSKIGKEPGHSFDIRSITHSICLETKIKRVTFDKCSSTTSLSKTRQSTKQNLITSLSFDTSDDIQIIEEKINVSPLKKKKGRLRAAPPKPLPPRVEELKKSQPARSSPKSASKKRGRKDTEKLLAETEEDQFSIPEGFLEILSNTTQTDSQASKAKPAKVTRVRRKKEELVTTSQHSSESESTPIKRSRRIQEQHQKKMSELAVEMEREQRMLEQLAKKTSAKKVTPQKASTKASDVKSPRVGKAKLKPPIAEEETCMETKRTTRKMNSRSRNITKMTLMYEDESKDSEFSTSRETEKSKKRRRGRGHKKGTGHRPWDVSSESSSTLEELTEEEEEEEPDEPLVFEVNEDEFACEEIDENDEPVIVRRARTAKKAPEDITAEETVVNDDKPCIKCGKYDRPEWILLCDKCDNGYHTTCLIPPLLIIPDGDWYCQPCEHLFLCECLQKELQKLEVVLKQREREELRKQRLAYVGISLDNVLKPEKKEKSDVSSKEEEEEEEVIETKSRRNKESSDDERHKKLFGKRSVRARRNVNYQFKEYDELIASAIQEEMLGVGVPLDEEFGDCAKHDDDDDSEKSFKAAVRPKRKKRTRKLNDLDFTDEDDSGEEYKGLSTDSEHTPPPSSNESEPESAASGEWRIVKTKGKPKRKARRGRRGRDSSDEEWDEGNNSDAYRPVTRRAAQKAISYRELSSDEDEEWNAAPKAKVPKKRKKASSSEDSELSFKKKPVKRKSRVRKWASSESSESENVSFKGSDTSQEESEDQWKIKENYEGNRIKININKKVLSSDGESSSQQSMPKKKSNKIESEEESEEGEEEEEEDEEEEEEGGSSSEEVDEEESDEESSNSKPAETKKLLPSKESSKIELPKAPEPQKTVIKALNSAENSTDSVKDKANPVNATVRDKPPMRTVKKDATKMVPCVIPYVKSPKSGHATTPDEESDKEIPKEKILPRLPFPKTVKPIQATQLPPSTPQTSNQQRNQPEPERRSFASTIMEPFSNMDEESEDSVPLERIPTSVPPSIPNKPRGFEQEYTPAKELSSFSYTTPEEKSFPPSYSSLAPFADFSSRPSPLKPSLVETYSNNSSPSKLTPLDNPAKLTPLDNPSKLMPLENPSRLMPLESTSKLMPLEHSSKLLPLDNPSKFTPLDSYSRSNSPRGFVSLDSYSEARKKKHFFGNTSMETEGMPRPVHPSDNYQGEIRFPPEPYPCPQSPNTYSQRSSPHVQRDPGTPPRLYSQFPDAYGPPRSPDYYQNHQYYGSEERIPRPPYQTNYVPPEQGPPYVPNPYVATPVPQPNGGFMIDTLLQARNPEEMGDELTGVTDIVSYITQEK